MSSSIPIHTIGHGRHPFAYFLELLRKHEIEFVCDVRAFARSRWPQFNGVVLAELLRENGGDFGDEASLFPSERESDCVPSELSGL